VDLLSKEITKNLLEYYSKDGKIATTNFLQRIIEDEQTKESVIHLANEVLRSSKFNEQATQVAHQISLQIMNDKDVIEEVKNLCLKVMLQNQTRENLILLFTNLFNEPKIIAELEILSTKVVAGEKFNSQVQTLAEKTSDQILSNTELTKKMAQFLSNSVDDNHLQEEVGRALWEAIKVALLPSVVRKSPPSPLGLEPSPVLIENPSGTGISLL